MTNELDQELLHLYQETILDHGRYPRNFCNMEDCTSKAIGFNSLCGDKIELFLKIKEGIIVKASFQGQGCAISQASCSLLTEIVKGAEINKILKISSNFQSACKGDENSQIPDKLLPLIGVKSFPARVKCATLAWHALEEAVLDTHN